MSAILRGTTNVIRYVMIVDDTSGAPETGATITNFNLQYTRAGEAPATKVDATALGATTTAHTDNKMIQVDATDSPGLYRVDWPDAAFAAGATDVILVVTSSDAFAPAVEDITLTVPVEFGTGAAISTPPKASTAGFTITWGENESNNENSTFILDGTTHDIEAANDTTEKIDVYYEFTVGGDGIPTGVQVHHQLDKGGGAGKNLQIYAYDWDNTQWDQIGLLESGTSLESDTYTLFASHVGTGSDLGKVRIRYETGSVAFSTTTKLLVDQILVEYTVVTRTSGYANGRIFVDTGASNTNTESFVDGVADNPVSTMAAAVTLSGQVNLTDFHILNGSSIQLTAAATKYSFFGNNWSLDLNGQSVVGIHVEGADITGAMAGTGGEQTFQDCHIGTASFIKGTHCKECRLEDTITIIEAGLFYFDDCNSGVPAGTPPKVDFGSGIGNTQVHFHGYKGDLQVEQIGASASTDTLHFNAVGTLTEGTCTGGAVEVSGTVALVSITNLTITETARLATDLVGTAAGMLMSGTSTASSTTTKVFVQTGDTPTGGADDDYNGNILIVWSTASKVTGQVNVRAIDDYDDSDPSFTISPALGFTPGSGDLVEIWKADSATSLTAITSGFGASSPDRLIDHLRSIMSKGAVTPASLGTYSPAADSLEFASERRALMEGAGFSTSTDSLEAIRDAITTLVAPAVVSASSLSGSGFLSDVVSLVRKATDEPSQSPKYTDGDIVEYLQVGMDTVITDIAVNTDHPIVVRYNVTLVDGTQYYILPPNVAELIRIAKINTTSGLPEYEVWPGSHFNPGGHGWKLEGNVLRLLRDWDSTDTLELMYYPNAEAAMHKATASAIDSTTVTFPTSVTDGTLGKRPNEYVGMLIRILSSTQNYVEERMITAYDLTTRIATVAKAWDTTPTGTVIYEVVPIFSRLIKHVVALRTAIDILSNEGNSQRMATLNQNYIIKLSAMRRALSKMEGRFPHHFDGDTWDNSNRGGFYG